jgi:glycosyltransferase involved in cell wall biosynthesis
MLRNMEPYDFPLRMNPACEALRNCVRRLGGYWACKRAAGVIAVSNYAGVLLRDKWGLPSYRIEVIYHGGTGLHECRPANRSDSIPSPVVFAAGSIRPARGLEDAVRAIALLLERGYGLGLTIAGGIDPGMTGYVRRLKRLSRDLGIESKISWRGRIGKCEMDALYRSSAAFVMTSRTEACPNIALEAMTAGSLSIGTDIPPIREIFGDTALYYSPGNVSELVDQICATVEFPAEERETRRRRAQERAAGFRWEETAQRTARFLTEVARGKRIG